MRQELTMMDNMSGVGKKVRKFRQESKATQRDIAERSGLTVSYLSRLENDRIIPSVRTLTRISEALDVPLQTLFDGETPETLEESCPVSLSGKCILEHRYIKQATELLEEEAYNQEQLDILQQCNDILQHGDQEMLTALERIVSSLVLLADQREKQKKANQNEKAIAVNQR